MLKVHLASSSGQQMDEMKKEGWGTRGRVEHCPDSQNSVRTTTPPAPRTQSLAQLDTKKVKAMSFLFWMAY